MAKARAGRPRNEDNPQIPLEPATIEGMLYQGDKEIWVEGSLIIHEYDVAALALVGPLGRLIERLDKTRKGTLEGPAPGHLTLSECRFHPGELGPRPRKYVKRQGFDTRRTWGTLLELIKYRPGRTLTQLAVELYPVGQGDPKLREPSLRVALQRLRSRGQLRTARERPDPHRPEVMVYYAVEPPLLRDRTQQEQLITATVRAWLSRGQPADPDGLILHLQQLVAFNAERPAEVWRDPRGVIKTPIDALPPWDEHLPPEPKVEDPF